MKRSTLRIHPRDNAIVALDRLPAGTTVEVGNDSVELLEPIPQKHKFLAEDLPAGGPVRMYGVLIGRTTRPLRRGSWLSRANLEHATQAPGNRSDTYSWHAPDIRPWADKTFLGFHRSNGSVGVANYYLVLPLVFCENHNLDTLEQALLPVFGYAQPNPYQHYAQQLRSALNSGADPQRIRAFDFQTPSVAEAAEGFFSNIDGIKFLRHSAGCGGTRSDAETLCQLLAGYITHPNCAGATVLSLGCQNAEIKLLKAAIEERYPNYDRHLAILDQQTLGSTEALLQEAIKEITIGLMDAPDRRPAPLSALCLGMECGGSDGFSGISANPVLGQIADYLVALGGRVILSEFPELNGVEQELRDRCVREDLADRFSELMENYSKRAEAVGSAFSHNPSPGNIKDGLITDAMKSAGAAKKGGSAPITDVLDYPEAVREPGLSLLCTPGNDVESTTGLAGAGAQIILFTTGLGTPTGNPLSPVVKVASNSTLAERMPDIIDLDAGSVVTGSRTIESVARLAMDYLIELASGRQQTAAQRNGQDDFIPWKRGISL